MTKVSVIIPCFNMGEHILETLDSVYSQTHPDIEIIIVNDGSTDKKTIDTLNKIDSPKVKIFHTANKGLGSARNTGILNSSGDYILPLDADDLIMPTYIEKALLAFDKHPSVKVVYCKVELFGAETGIWDLPNYSFPAFLEQNQIFCTALFRKSDYEKTNGYSTKMSYMGWEDWDFWLSLLELCKEKEYANFAFRMPEVLFQYRIRHQSMIRILDQEKDTILRREIYLAHLNLYSQFFEDPITLKYSLESLRKEHDKLLKNYNGLQNSRALMLGRFLLSPLKMILKTNKQ